MDLLEEYSEVLHPAYDNMEVRCGGFTVQINFPQLYDTARLIRESYEKNPYYVTVGNLVKHTSRSLFDADMDSMLRHLDSLRTDPKELMNLVASAPKKFDGTFHKGRVTIYSRYLNTAIYQEGYHSWEYFVIRMKALSDTIANISISKELQHR